VKDAPDEWTAQAFITTDSLGNQLTTFHAGAMDLLQVPDCEALSGVSAAHIAPGGLRSMASQGELYRKLGIPYVFDPGQATSQLSPAALTELSLGSMLICVSEYEEKLLADRTGLDRKKLVTPSRSLLVTRGGEGSVIYTEEREIRIPAVQPLRIRWEPGTPTAEDSFGDWNSVCPWKPAAASVLPSRPLSLRHRAARRTARL